MGMIDTVNLSCPHCERRTSFQTKDGVCQNNQYELAEMPADIAKGLEWRNVRCESCDTPIQFKRTLQLVSVEAVSEPNPQDEILYDIFGAKGGRGSDLPDRFSGEEDDHEDDARGERIILP